MSNTGIKPHIREAAFRDALIRRLIRLNVDTVDAPLIEIAGRLGGACVVTAKEAGLSKVEVIQLLTESYDKVDQLECELGLNTSINQAGISHDKNINPKEK